MLSVGWERVPNPWPIFLVADMTYNVFGGTLNLAQSQSINFDLCCCTARWHGAGSAWCDHARVPLGLKSRADHHRPACTRHWRPAGVTCHQLWPANQPRKLHSQVRTCMHVLNNFWHASNCVRSCYCYDRSVCLSCSGLLSDACKLSASGRIILVSGEVKFIQILTEDLSSEAIKVKWFPDNYFASCVIFVPSGGISVILFTNIPHVSGHCGKGC